MGETRTVVVDGVRQVYRVEGRGPVCLVHPGGPGVHPEYLRMPALEGGLTLVYLDPVGSGDSGLLPDGDYSMSRYARFAEAVLDDLGAPAPTSSATPTAASSPSSSASSTLTALTD